MEVLYKYGGLKGGEIGRMMALDYSTASQGRKGSRERLKRIRSYRDLGEVRGKFVHGRNAGYPAPPAQIPACTTNALGSCFKC